MSVLIEGFVAAYHPTAEPFQWREGEVEFCGGTQPIVLEYVVIRAKGGDRG